MLTPAPIDRSLRPFALKAHRLLDIASAARPTDVIGTGRTASASLGTGISTTAVAPTITAGTPGAAATLGLTPAASAPVATTTTSAPIGDGRFPMVSGKFNPATGKPAYSTINGSRSDANSVNMGCGFAFQCDGQAFEFLVQTSASTAGFAIRVNGQWANQAGYNSGTADTGLKWIKVDFATAAQRHIELFVNSNVTIWGFNWGAIGIQNSGAGTFAGAARIWAPALALDVKAAFFGDSYAVSPGGTHTRGSLPHVLGEELGIPHIVPLAMPGQGWVKTPSGSSDTFATRIAAGDIEQFGQQDILFLHGSVNDWQQSASAVQAAVSAGVAAIMANQPGALIFMASTFRSSGQDPGQTISDAVKAGFNAVADPARMALIDTMAEGWDDASTLATGSGGTGYANADAIHKLNAGYRYYARRYAEGVRRQLAVWAVG